MVRGDRPDLRDLELQATAGGRSRVQYLASVLAGIETKDPQGTAERLLDHFGSLAAFASADRASLEAALTEIPALPRALAAAQEIAFAATRERVHATHLNPSDPQFLDYLRLGLGGRRSEVLLGFFSALDGALLCERVLAQSDGHAVAISAAAALRVAISVGAAGIVLVHNHPSGLARPSKADERSTKAIMERGAALDIQLLDHLIVGGVEVYSMNKGRVL